MTLDISYLVRTCFICWVIYEKHIVLGTSLFFPDIKELSVAEADPEGGEGGSSPSQIVRIKDVAFLLENGGFMLQSF